MLSAKYDLIKLLIWLETIYLTIKIYKTDFNPFATIPSMAGLFKNCNEFFYIGYFKIFMLFANKLLN